MKVAIVSTGLGRVLRGFESFSDSLFQALRKRCPDPPDLDVTLFQGGGNPGHRRVIVRNLHRADAPARWFGPYRANLLEQRSFALALYPLLRRRSYDIVHYNELVFGSALFHLRRLFGGKFTLLYCNGAPSPPIHYHHRCDFIQQLNSPMRDEALSFGIPDMRMFLLPYGVDADVFSPALCARRAETRAELGIPEDAPVVLTVAALKSEHKRVDHVIRELSKLKQPVWFLAAGQRTGQTAELEQLAEKLMPSRWRFVSWPHQRVPHLYGAADLFVLGSLTEGLPIVSLEAMLAGLPLILHNAPLFRWLAQDTPVELVDMSAPGELARLAEQVLSQGRPSSRAHAQQRFSWDSLVPKYMMMYQRVMGHPSETRVPIPRRLPEGSFS